MTDTKQRLNVQAAMECALLIVLNALYFALAPRLLAAVFAGSRLVAPLAHLLWLALCAALCWRNNVTAFELGFARRSVWRQLLLGVALAASLAALFLGLPLLLGVPAGHLLAAAAPNARTLAFNLAHLVLIVGPAEEFIFRGALRALVERAYPSFALALLVTSLLFGAAHQPHPLQMLLTALIGALLFAARRIPGVTLLSLMAGHGLYNGVLEIARWFLC